MSDLLAERYGTPKRARRMLLLVLVGVIAVAGLGWLGWAAWFHGNQPIRAEVVSFEATSTHEVRVRLDVDLADEDVTGSCLLRATAADHSVVGELDVRVEDLVAADDPWVTLRTERKATTVERVSCRTD